MTAPIAPVQQGLVCRICDNPLYCRWTDTHGVGACRECGAPYRIYHYDSDKKLLPGTPELLLKGGWIPVVRRYWKETGRNVNPGGFNFRGSSYEVATQEDVDSIDLWMEAHKDELPV